MQEQVSMIDKREVSFETSYHQQKEKDFRALETFGQITSIRGVQKVQKAKSRFVRFLWIIFIISMTTWLISTTILFIIDFLKFNTVWNLHTVYNDETEFPSLTICAQNPFSIQAKEAWDKKDISTPVDVFKKRINTTLNLLKKLHVHKLSLALLDTTDQYFASLTREEIHVLSHNVSMIPFCSIKVHGSVIIADQCNFAEMDDRAKLRIREFIHPRYFKCFTIEPINEGSSYDIEELVLLIRIVPQSDLPLVEKSFISDTLFRGDGLRIVVHEHKTFPDLEQNGINLQAGRMNDLFFNTHKLKSLRTPINICTDKIEMIKHMGIDYIGSSDKCQTMHENLNVIRNCGCAITETPIPFNSTDQWLPFCSKLPNNFTIEALKGFNASIECAMNHQEVENAPCTRRCTQYQYKVSSSFSVWRPSNANLVKFKEIYRNINLDEKEIVEYFENLVKNYETGDEDEKNFLDIGDDNHFTHIRLKKQNKDTIVEEERLVSDISVLISRIGGICSLSIGLTTSFFVEIIEFTYLFISRKFRQERLRMKETTV